MWFPHAYPTKDRAFYAEPVVAVVDLDDAAVTGTVAARHRSLPGELGVRGEVAPHLPPQPRPRPLDPQQRVGPPRLRRHASPELTPHGYPRRSHTAPQVGSARLTIEAGPRAP